MNCMQWKTATMKRTLAVGLVLVVAEVGLPTMAQQAPSRPGAKKQAATEKKDDAPKGKKPEAPDPMADPFGDLEKLDDTSKKAAGVRVPWEAVLPKSYFEQINKTLRPAAKATTYQKKHASVLSEFKPVVRRAALGTVFVLSGGKIVALGTIVDRKGSVLTKASVISRQPVIRYNNGTVAAVDIVAVHDKFDLALLRPRPGQPKSGMPVRWEEEPSFPGMLAAAPAPSGNVIASGVISVATRRPFEAKGFLGIAPRQTEKGVVIERVEPKSAAAECGLQPGDVLLKINDHEIEAVEDVFAAIGKHAPGDEIEISYRREEEEHTGKAVLGSRRLNAQRAGRFERMNRMSGPRSSRRMGFPFVLQHDLEIPPQLCGGPLVDIEGRVIGINIARAGRVQTLAIPADQVVRVLADMRAGKLPPPKDFGKKAVDVEREIKAIRTQIERLQKRLKQLEAQRPH